MRVVVLAVIVAGSLQVSAPSASAQKGQEKGTVASVKGVPAVDTSALHQSAHAKLVCVACHTSLDVKRTPYRGKVEPVVCVRCHTTAEFKHPFHPEVAQSIRSGVTPKVTCKECHGTHDVASAKVPGSTFSASRLTESCGKCHEKVSASYAGSAHEQALVANELGAPTCLSCHRQTLTFARAATDSLTVKAAQVRACLTCHLDSPDVKTRVATSTVLVSPWAHSAHGTLLEHGKAAAANCVDCHGSHGIRKKSEPGSTVGKDSVTTMCARCHVAAGQKFNGSVHGAARTSAKTDSMTCATCHSDHAKAGEADTLTGAARTSSYDKVCARCHDPVAYSGTYGISSDRFKDFSDSYHGVAVHDGTVAAANCASCHGAHDVKPKKDSTSSVNVANREATCGKCHRNAVARFDIAPVHLKVGERVSAAARSWLAPVGLLLVAGVAGGIFLFGRRRKVS
ncbi:MAG: hypothetical protein HY084_14360 [Gemmatimonadetes bacterium]|nr:hypothetical protein [Gemmatimonadota bacterium]